MKNKMMNIVSVATALLCVPLLCGEICAAEPVVTASGNVSMDYLPGTSEAVSNIPPATSFVRGESYEVAASVPTRDGYEFTGWKLDYTTHEKVDVTVRFVRASDEIDIAPSAGYSDIAYPGDTIVECALDIEYYDIVEPNCQTIIVPDDDFSIIFKYTDSSGGSN